MAAPGLDSASRAALALDAAHRVAARGDRVTLAGERLLPVLDPLADLLPWAGLLRGSVVAAGTTSLALALAAGPSAGGSWVAAAGLPRLGLAAAAELGLALERLALVPEVDGDRWAAVLGALVGAFDVVLVSAAAPLRHAEGRRLVARARERGTVVVPVGPAGRARSPALEADVSLRPVEAGWQGLGRGHGHLQARRVVVEAAGRRAAARPRRAELWLPGPDGGVQAVAPSAEVVAGPWALVPDGDPTPHPGGDGRARAHARAPLP